MLDGATWADGLDAMDDVTCAGLAAEMACCAMAATGRGGACVARDQDGRVVELYYVAPRGADSDSFEAEQRAFAALGVTMERAS